MFFTNHRTQLAAMVFLVAGALMFLAPDNALDARAKKKSRKSKKDTEQVDTVKKETKYDKLFKKQHTVDEGMITLHLLDGKVYFDYPNTTPKITVKRGEEKLPVEDPVFFEKLVNSIDGKPIPETVPFYPEYIYLVEIGKYDFALHEGHIIIYSPLGRNIKGQEIIEVECTKEEISELVELLDAAK